MAERNKPAGIRSLVYGMGKGKAGIEGLSVSAHRLIIDRVLAASRCRRGVRSLGKIQWLEATQFADKVRT